MKTTLLAIAAAASVSFAAHATPISPSQAEDVIESAGATLTGSQPAGEGSHTIDASLGEVNITVRLGNCAEDDTCGYAMMFSTFDLGQAADANTLAKSNSYNDSYPFGRAFVVPSEDEGGDLVGIDYVIDLSGEAELDAGDIAQFEQVLKSYIAHWTTEE